MAIWDIKERNDIVRANDNRTQKAVLFTDVSNKIKTFSMVSQGNSIDFGLMTKDRTVHGGTGSSSTTRGLISGVEASGNVDDIDYIEIAHNGNAADFGNLSAARGYAANIANNTRAITFGGGNSGMKDIIDFGTIANTGNFVDFGNLSVARDQLAGTTSPTRAIFAGGSDGASPSSNAYNTIDFCTIASTGNAADFGDLTVARINGGMTGSQIRGTFAGGQNPQINVIDYITIATAGNATDFGDLTAARRQNGMMSNNVYGYSCGGSHSQNVIDRWLIASTGNATDWADLDEDIGGSQGVSGSHGGIDLSTPGSQRPSVNYMPGSGRGIAMGGYNSPGPKSTIELIHIPTLGNSSDFGDMHTGIAFGSANSSLTRTIMQGGYNNALTTEVDQIQLIEHASQGNGSDFGNLLSTRANSTSTGSCSSTRGLSEGGGAGGSSVVNEIEYITMATLGNGTDFGNLTVAREVPASCSNGTRGVTGGGAAPGVSNVMDYVTIASTGNSTDFGNLTVARARNGALSSSTRGVFSGGDISPADSNTIDYITIASTGNATDFGNLSAAKTGPNGMSNSTRGVFVGGRTSPANLNVIEYITIASTGDVSDFGDLSEIKEGIMCGSDSHGGLQH